MILGFKKKFPWGKPSNFEKKILDGSKIHTFREDKRGRWKPGVLIHFATGIRTRFYNCFKKGVCKSTQSIRIEKYDTYYGVEGPFYKIYINSEPVFDDVVEKLAKNDGFDSLGDFFKWFNTDFHGKIIHWTDFKY